MPPDRALRGRGLLAAVGLTAALAPADPSLAQEHALRFDTPPLSLAHPIVVSMLQDRRGFVWIGTQGGLVRYDGHSTLVYSGIRGSSRSLPSSAIRDIHEHSDGRLWLATLSGLAIISEDRDSVVAVSSETRPDLFPLTDAVNSLAELSDGSVAAGLDGGGLLILDASGQNGDVHVPDPADPHSIPSGTVDAVLVTADGTLWAGTYGGLVKRAPGARRWERVPLPEMGAAVGPDEPRRLSVDPTGAIWVGGLDGVVRLDPATGAARRLRLGPYRVQSLLTNHPDSIWVGTYGNGLLLLDGEGRVVQANMSDPAVPQTLRDGRVSALMQDRTGLLWVGLWGSGVQTADPGGAAFRLIPANVGLAGEDVTSIRRHPSGRELLVSTYSGGVNVLRPNGALVRTIDVGRVGAVNEPAEVLSALWPPGDDLYVGTMRLGIQRVAADGGIRSYTNDPSDSLSAPHAAVYDLVRDREGRTWVGTSLGLRRFDPDSGTFHPPPANGGGELLANAFVRNIHLADDGRLWIGTMGDGLFILDPATGDARRLHASRYDDIPDDEVAAVTTLGGYGWFGTRSGGTLHRVSGWESEETLVIEAVGPAEGLGSAIQCLTPDARGRLWASTSSQIVRIDPAALELAMFGPADGLSSAELRTASCALGPSGQVWFGQQTGVTVFHPDSVGHPHAAAETVVSVATFGDTEVIGPIADGGYEATYPDGMVTFRLSVLDFRSPATQTFAYRLNGGAWTSLGSQSDVTFADLLPGRYTFQARGRDAHGVQAEPSDPLTFEILPPFTMTAWFRAIVLLVIAGFVVGIFQWRTRTIRRHNAELLREIAERERLEAQGAALEDQLRQSQKMEAVGRLTGGIAHDFNNILTVLMGNAELLLESSDEPQRRALVREIHESGRVASNLVSQLLVFSRKRALSPSRTNLVALLERMAPMLRRSLGVHVTVELDVEPDEASAMVDANQMESAVLNLAINARDAMPEGGHLTLALRRYTTGAPDHRGVPAGDWWLLSVCDTGTGIPPHVLDRIFEPFFTTKGVGRGSGLGLAMVYGFVDQSGGHVRAESTEGEGSRFAIYLPVVEG
ncbi:MAG TPA: two-component regulator propeller domain-containing protein [Longimicrobiales bacterium]|nr:two-component regulator propeller domain-containing protein [Longimicrobiales bacterium]